MPARLRVRYTDWPVPAVELTDTPRPGCPHCRGEGGRLVTGLGCDVEHDLCNCWDPARAWLLTYVPRWIARRFFGWREPAYTDETPF